MGKKVEETSQSGRQRISIGEAGTDEQALRAQLLQLVQSASGQLGNLSALAGGEGLMPTAEDIELANRVADASVTPAFEQASQQLEGSLLDRGIEGSSIEAVDRAILGREAARSRSGLTSQILLDQPTKRAEVQLGANKVLFDRIMGAANPALKASLSERLAQTTTRSTGQAKTETSGATFAELLAASPVSKVI